MEKCVTCQAPATLRCSKCKVARYCSVACQKANWPAHRELCAIVSDTSSWKNLEGHEELLKSVHQQGLKSVYDKALEGDAMVFFHFCEALEDNAAILPAEKDAKLAESWIAACSELGPSLVICKAVSDRAMVETHALPPAAAIYACGLLADKWPIELARMLFVIVCNVPGAEAFFGTLMLTAPYYSMDGICARILYDLLQDVPGSEAMRAKCEESFVADMEDGFTV